MSDLSESELKFLFDLESRLATDIKEHKEYVARIEEKHERLVALIKKLTKQE